MVQVLGHFFWPLGRGEKPERRPRETRSGFSVWEGSHSTPTLVIVNRLARFLDQQGMKPLDRLNWAYSRTELPPASKAVLVYLAFVDGKDCFPKVETIVACTGFSRRTVQKALADLEARELIEREQRYWRSRRTSSRYLLSYDDRTSEERAESRERSLRSAPVERPATPQGCSTRAPGQASPAPADAHVVRPLREQETKHEGHQEGEPVMQQEVPEGVALDIESDNWIEIIDGRLYLAEGLSAPELIEVVDSLHHSGWDDSAILGALRRAWTSISFPTQRDLDGIVLEIRKTA